MTIDEMIQKARNNENIFKNNHKLNLTLKKRSPYYGLDCLKISEDNKHLAEWLEELKAYRASVFSGDMTQKMLKEEYNKAVDDFAESVKNLIVDLSVIRFKDIDEIAEQLKAGDEE